GLMLDNVAVLVLLAGTITLPAHATDRFTPEFVIARMVPGTALGVLIGDLVYTWLAFRLAKRLGRDDVTAMPLGLDTPSSFAVGFLVLLPALGDWLRDHPGDRDTAMYFAWHVGAVSLVLSGLFKTAIAPLGNAVRRWVPRAGLLGSLAAIALALIAFMPLLTEIAAVPLVGMLALAVILVTLVAHRPLPGHLPGALVAVLVGLAAWFFFRAVENTTGLQLVSGNDVHGLHLTGTVPPMPAIAWEWPWWQRVFLYALGKLPVVLPFALATVIGGIDCTESAAAIGEEYDTRTILLTEGLATTVAGLCGGVIQNTPYIGQPAYKAMGGRAAYTLATALFIGVLGFSGLFHHLFDWLPKVVMFPVLVFVGLEITAQSFHATPVKHYPAVALASLPALAYLGNLLVGMSLGPNPPANAEVLQTLHCLANGFIITSLLWGAALAAMLDGQLRRSAAYLLTAGACSLFGIIHSPFADQQIAWPWDVMRTLPTTAALQSPLHWAAAYGLMAGFLLVLAELPSPRPQPIKEPEPTSEGSPPLDTAIRSASER
ncbi:MAG: permease, partial [Planctomycetia bacterium]|nr:permease [Planctomycetia bacterium]